MRRDLVSMQSKHLTALKAGEHMPEKKFNKQEYDNKYIKENKDRINFLMEKGTKEKINLAAKALNISASEFVRQAIEEKLCSFDKLKE